jgi:hypothetical protein
MGHVKECCRLLNIVTLHTVVFYKNSKGMKNYFFPAVILYQSGI